MQFLGPPLKGIKQNGFLSAIFLGKKLSGLNRCASGPQYFVFRCICWTPMAIDIPGSMMKSFSFIEVSHFRAIIVTTGNRRIVSWMHRSSRNIFSISARLTSASLVAKIERISSITFSWISGCMANMSKVKAIDQPDVSAAF